MEKLGETIIEKRFNGPPQSGNGGVGAGRLAMFLDGPHTIRISAPIPLETPLNIMRADDQVFLMKGDDVIMTARPAKLKLTAPSAPSIESAREANANLVNFGADGETSCFVCGRNRAEGDGMRVWAGEAQGVCGALEAWTLLPSFCDEAGQMRTEFIYGALDCPGGASLPEENRRVLLGEMTAAIHTRPKAGDELIIHAWHDHSEGRKHFAGTALYSATGQLLAQADTLWIQLKPEQISGMFG